MNILIIGFGSIGKRHYEILSKLDDTYCIDLVTKQNIKEITTYKSLEKVKLENYEYIVVASKTSLHYEHLKFLEENCINKTILIEKPVFAKNEELEIKNNRVFVAYNRRYYPILQKINELTQKDNCYSINVMTGQYLPFWRPTRDYKETYSAKKDEGGGVLLDLSHEIDYIQFLCGEMNILSSINTKVSDLEIDSDDFCTVLAKTNNNIFVNFTIDYISKEFIQNITVHLKESSLFADLKNMRLKIVNKSEEIEELDFSKFDIDYSFTQMHLDVLQENEKKCCTYLEGIKIMKKIEEIKRVNHAKI